MWQAFFVAVGIALLVLGGECLLIDSAVITRKVAAAEDTLSGELTSSLGAQAKTARREVKPPEWAPWSLISAGAVVLLYSITLPKRSS